MRSGLQRRLTYFPDRSRPRRAESVLRGGSDVTLSTSDGLALGAWYVAPEDPGGAVLVCNGNGGNLTHRGGLAANFRRSLGAGVLLFDYPGYGKSAGSPSEEGCYAAGEAAFNWLTDEQKIPANRVILCGQSLGGGTAVELATRHDHRALVLIYTFASVPAVAKDRFPFLPTHTLMRTRFDNLSKIGRCTRPVFFVHGTADRVIPFNHSEQLYTAANEPKHFLRIEDFGHSSVPDDVFAPELVKFLDRHAP